MSAATTLLNLDLAVGVSAVVASAMVIVPNIDRIRLLRRSLTRRPVQRTQQRLVTGDQLTA